MSAVSRLRKQMQPFVLGGDSHADVDITAVQQVNAVVEAAHAVAFAFDGQRLLSEEQEASLATLNRALRRAGIRP